MYLFKQKLNVNDLDHYYCCDTRHKSHVSWGIFVAGVWFMHCHFERHVSWGMGMAFIIKDGKLPEQKILPPPKDMPLC